MAEEKKQYKREGKKYELKKSAARAAREDGLKDDQFEVVPVGKEWAYKVKGNGAPTATDSMRKQFEKTDAKHKKQDEASKKRSPVGERPTPGHPAHAEPEKKEEVEAMPTDPAIDRPAQPHEPTYSDHPIDDVKKDEPAKPVVKRQLTPDEQYRQDMAEIQRMRQEEAAKPPVEKPKAVLPEEKPLPPPAPAPRVMKVVPASERPKPGRLHKSQIESPTKTVWAIADEMFEKGITSRKLVIEECTKRGIAYFTARTQYQQWLSARRESEENAKKANSKNKSTKK